MAVKFDYISSQDDIDDEESEREWQEYISHINKTPNGNMTERLTLSEIEDKYPRQWVGLTNIEYNDDNVNIISAVVGYINMSKDELTALQILGLCEAWYTSPNSLEVL